MAPKTILLVDPHKDSRVVYATMLSRSGFQVLEAADDEEGLRIARMQGPDLILTELFPWNRSGKMLPERLRETRETESIPVIALTAHILVEDWAQVLGRCCSRVLTKPCGPRRVLEEIEGVVFSSRIPAA
ncbi:MAG TPA: response regulator [Longimicrobiaceae bacterium]|nr:response regulator [Longimicrobiaceae bacterium]